MFVYFFGNLASLVEDLAPFLKNNFEKKSKKDIALIKNLHLEQYLV